MKRPSFFILIFAILSLVFFLLLIFLRTPFPPYGLMSYQDAIDVLTPLVLIPMYWAMFRSVRRPGAGLWDEITFMILSAFWAAGQGMHLSANSIDNLIGHLAGNQGMDPTGTQIFQLTYFYDEYLSHYLWHIGVLGLAGLLIYEAWHRSPDEKTDWRLIVPAAILYGMTYFCIVVEGNTLPIGLPFATIIVALVILWGRGRLSQQPVLAFFFASCTVAFVLIVGWRVYWGGFPPILQALNM